MKIQMFTVVVPNGIPSVRIYRDQASADAWLAENNHHHEDKAYYAPASMDVPLFWLEEQADRARSEFDVEQDDYGAGIGEGHPR